MWVHPFYFVGSAPLAVKIICGLKNSMHTISCPGQQVGPSNNIFLRGMEGSLLPVACAHGEGRVEFDGSMTSDAVQSNNLAPIRFVGPDNAPTTAFPFNPNGSPSGITGQSSCHHLLGVLCCGASRRDKSCLP